jgi:hypothetical protein
MRRKKSDEVKPACSQCQETGRKCDFLPLIVQRPLTQKLGCSPLSDIDVAHFEYFRDVCAPEFALYFELPLWERFVLEACTEPCIGHAALAIGALSRIHYRPDESTSLAAEYSIKHYNMAIRQLNNFLDASTRSLELAIMASIVFIVIEVLQGHDNQVQTLLHSAFALLRAHPAAAIRSDEQMNRGVGSEVFDLVSPTTLTGATLEVNPKLDCLVRALHLTYEQASSFNPLLY